MARKGFRSFGKRNKFFEELIALLAVAVTAKFELSEQMDDGLTLETHLLNYWRQSGEMPEQLNYPSVPYELEYVWGWWVSLHATRSIGMSESPISYTEIQNWSTLLQINVNQFEVRCIIAIDSAYFTCRSKQQENSAATTK